MPQPQRSREVSPAGDQSSTSPGTLSRPPRQDFAIPQTVRYADRHGEASFSGESVSPEDAYKEVTKRHRTEQEALGQTPFEPAEPYARQSQMQTRSTEQRTRQGSARTISELELRIARLYQIDKEKRDARGNRDKTREELQMDIDALNRLREQMYS